MTRQDADDFLEKLRHAVGEPWTLEEDLVRFFESPEALEFLRGGEASVRQLLDVVGGEASAPWKRFAVLALSRFPPELFYEELLSILERAGAEVVEAFDAGLWLVALPPDRIARDLIDVVRRSHNPHPLLLLQRPAARSVKSDLAAFIERGEEPFAGYARSAIANAG